MFILITVLLIVSFIYLYNLHFIPSKSRNICLLFILYVIWTFVTLVSIKDMYYFYLLYKLLNICSYMLIIKLSINPINFRSSIYYYFLGFFSSLLFIIGLYDLTNSDLSIYLIDVSILIKLRVWPFSGIIADVYTKASFSSYITISYLLNYIYISLLFVINLVTMNQDFWYNFLLLNFISITTFISVYHNFNKQTELKGFTAYSSISNVPIIISPLLLTSNITNYSINYYSTTLVFIGFYTLIYSTNIILLNIFSMFLEPIQGKK